MDHQDQPDSSAPRKSIDLTIPASRNNPVLDRRVLDELRELSDTEQDLVQDLINLFLADSPMQMLALQEALRSENCIEVERRSHRLKGSAGSIGAIRLREICEQIECFARAGRLPTPEEAAFSVNREFEALREELELL